MNKLNLKQSWTSFFLGLVFGFAQILIQLIPVSALAVEGGRSIPEAGPYAFGLVVDKVFACRATRYQRADFVTAAHCVSELGPDGNIRAIAANRLELLSLEEEGRPTLIPVESLRIFSESPMLARQERGDLRTDGTSNYSGDLALLRVDFPATIPLSPVNLNRDEIGSIRNFREVFLVGKDDGVTGLGRVENRQIQLRAERETNEGEFIAFSRVQSGTSICRGDSGGGVFGRRQDGLLVLIGVSSMMTRSWEDAVRMKAGANLSCFHGLLFSTNIAKYREQIDRHIEEMDTRTAQ